MLPILVSRAAFQAARKAGALLPEIAAAYDGAQDRAAEQVIGWLAQHATTR